MQFVCEDSEEEHCEGLDIQLARIDRIVFSSVLVNFTVELNWMHVLNASSYVFRISNTHCNLHELP